MENINKLKQAEIELHKKISKNYDEIRWDKKNPHYYNILWNSNLLDEDFHHKKVLDYSCGIGHIYPMLMDKFPMANYVGSDLSPDMLNLAKQKYPKATFIEADGENLPFEANTFDVVIARAALHHIPDHEKGVEEISRVLKTNGLLINSEPPDNFIVTFARNFYRTITKDKDFTEVHKSFKVKDYLKVLEKNNLKVESIYYWGYFAYVFSFPDMVPLFNFMPHWLFRFLIKVDNVISKIPFVRRFSWYMTIRARKEKK